MIGGVAGITADANSLVNYARTAAQQHLFSYDEDIPVEQLAQRLCDLKQGYTQYGGVYVGRSSLMSTHLVGFQVYDRSASRYYMRVTMSIINSNYTTLIHRGTILDGKQRVSVLTMAQHKVF